MNAVQLSIKAQLEYLSINVKPVYNPEYDFVNTYLVPVICYITRLSNHIHEPSYINIHPILHVKLT